ncbi:MAG: hypothetical protein NXI04_15115 [Planctomycetaceae bacterium]|nr:hypothetical protein [Planctomycetaceae bacterium]
MLTHRTKHRIAILCVCVLAGCSRKAATPATDPVSDSENAAPQSSVVYAQDELPEQITNQFGAVFCRVNVDTQRPDHQETFPTATYYLQKTELDGTSHKAFRKAAWGDGSYESIDWNFNGGFPSEWREVERYAAALSKFDTQYDYCLPTQAQWAFACMNGYEQSCPGDGAQSTVDSTDSVRPNSFGIEGFMNYDVECTNEPGVFMGKSTRDNSCRCRQVTKGNPDADDGLNELITGRLVLILQSRDDGD